ncbi:MAG: class I SAM-dependent methyltransferase [Xanthomonadales bacterium]|nr:class I SAM-dependent methyltransferase [Xanthomonadales bacterium]
MTDTDNPGILDFTGERFTPECVREMWYEHWHRYALAQPLAAGRRVLDAACGEGYGSAFLAEGATEVTGVDVDAQTIEHARRRYGDRAGLQFRQGSVAELPLADASVDLVVSFETIEHLDEQARMVSEFARVLAPGGCLLISSPDRHAYNAQGDGTPNPFHVRELDRDEFTGLLRPHFPAIRLYGQRLAFQSTVWAVEPKTEDRCEQLRMDAADGVLRRGGDPSPVYWLAMCARSEADLPSLPSVSVFADAAHSIYAHYNQEIRRVIQADRRIIELERELAVLRARPASAREPGQA